MSSSESRRVKRRTVLAGSAAAAATASFPLAAGTAVASEPVVAKFATVAPEGTPWAEQLKQIRARVEKETGGSLKLKTFLGGTLGDENATASECKRGALQLWGGSTAALATLVPELALLELPYLFHDGAEADHVIDDVLSDDLAKLLAARGLVLLIWAENGFRSFGTTFGPVKSPAALKGKKMRSQESDIHIETYRALGASPVPIAVTEVLSSLQTGVVDGFDQTPLYAFAASWYQGVKHYTLTEAIYQPGAIVANKAWFDKLSPEHQKALRHDPKGEAVKGRKGVRELAPLLIENFKNAGVEVHTLTAEEKRAYAKACEAVHGRWLAGKGKAAAPLVKKAKAALEQLRKKTG